MVIYISEDRQELGSLRFIDLDVDINNKKDFELTVPITYYNELNIGCFIAIDNSEVGGRITASEINSSEATIKFTGKTWRGILESHVIEPKSEHEVINGSVEHYFLELFRKKGLIDHFDMQTTESVSNLRLNRFCTVLDALKRVSEETAKKLVIYYDSSRGKAFITFSKIRDYSRKLEINKNNSLSLKIKNSVGGVNHLICLGQGELTDRVVIHMYLDDEGDIVGEQHFKGIEEITAIYEYTSADEEELTKKGEEHFKSLIEKPTVSMEVERLIEEADIGDKVGARDSITGTYKSETISNKIIKMTMDNTLIEYKVEE